MSDMTRESRSGSDVAPVPAGYTSITPYLCVGGAARAIAFYEKVFGATVVTRNDGPDGTVAHAELDFGHGRLQLSDPAPAHNLVPPDGTDQVNHSYVHYCADADAVYNAAVAEGAKGFGEPATFVTGDRFGAVLDPFGHRWTLMTRVEDVSPDEAQRRVDEWVAEQAASTG
jgi:PhnB protein